MALLAVSSHAAPDPMLVQLQGQRTSLSLDRHSRYWLDASADPRRRTVQEVAESAASLPWFVYESGRPHAFDSRTLWLQFDAVRPTSGAPWYLEVASAGLDRASLYYRDANGQWVTQEAGDGISVSQWPLPGRYPTFALSSAQGHPVRYWLRIEQNRVDLAPTITLYTHAALSVSRDRNQFLLGAYVGLTLLMAGVALGNAFAYRDRLFAAYALYVLGLTTGQLSHAGIGAQYLWSDAPAFNVMPPFALLSLSFVVGLWFMRRATTPARFSLGLDSLVLAMMLLQAIMIAVDAQWGSAQTYAGMMAFNMLIMVVISVIIGRVWLRGNDPHIRLVALGILPMLILALFPLARSLGLIPASFWTRYGLILGSALQIPTLYYALSRRSNHLQETSARARALSETDPLTGLTHQNILRMRLDLALARARQQHNHCALLGIHLANYPKIVEQQGQEAADRALVVAAARLRRVITDIDIVARTGECQFVMLLENPVTGERARSCATHIVAQGLQDLGVLPDGEALRFHVAVAVLPEHEMNAADSLTWVTEVAASLPRDTRRPIVMLNV